MFTDCLSFIDLPSTGRFRILCLTSTDLLDPNGQSVKRLSSIAQMIEQFPVSLIELIVLHPQLSQNFEWCDIPTCVKNLAEMRFYNAYKLEDAYGIYGVNPHEGALVVIRPDGYVGVTAQLVDTGRVLRFLKACITLA